jgi:hypothetical protein
LKIVDLCQYTQRKSGNQEMFMVERGMQRELRVELLIYDGWVIGSYEHLFVSRSRPSETMSWPAARQHRDTAAGLSAGHTATGKRQRSTWIAIEIMRSKQRRT